MGAVLVGIGSNMCVKYAFLVLWVLGASGVRHGLSGRHSKRSAPQILMSKCPLDSRCVGRHFCDENGLITLNRNKRLKFSEDKRGLIVCVDSVKNRLGVCCTDQIRLFKPKRRVRQDKREDEGDGLNHDEYSGSEDELFGGDPVIDINEDSNIIFNRESIETLIEQAKETEITASIPMVNEQDTNKEHKTENGHVADVQARPIVVINIHAADLGLGERNKKLDIIEALDETLRNSEVAISEVEKPIEKELKKNVDEDERINPDSSFFGRDYIQISMESHFPDQRYHHRGYNDHPVQDQIMNQPVDWNTLRNMRPYRRLYRHWM